MKFKPKTAAERMRAFRFRKRELKRVAGTLRPVGRPKNEHETPSPQRAASLSRRLHATWETLREKSVKNVSFRSLRYWANRNVQDKFQPQEIVWWLDKNGSDHFYCKGKSLEGLPLKITVLDPV